MSAEGVHPDDMFDDDPTIAAFTHSLAEAARTAPAPAVGASLASVLETGMAAPRADVPTVVGPRRRVSRLRWAVGGAVFGLGVGGLGVAGALPEPVQKQVSRVADVVGVHIPDGASDPTTTTTPTTTPPSTVPTTALAPTTAPPATSGPPATATTIDDHGNEGEGEGDDDSSGSGQGDGHGDGDGDEGDEGDEPRDEGDDGKGDEGTDDLADPVTSSTTTTAIDDADDRGRHHGDDDDSHGRDLDPELDADRSDSGRRSDHAVTPHLP